MTAGIDRQAGQVLDFWFGPANAPDFGKPRAAWFTKDQAFDLSIGQQFDGLIEDALAGRCEHWLARAESALAYLILLDQFTRNVFRHTPGMYAGDGRALAAARRIIAQGWDQSMLPVQRWFCYLPFEHAENLADQHEAVRLFEQLRFDPQSTGAIEYSYKHREVIEQFGRFPHRNEILGRASTEIELEYLKQPGAGF